MPKRPLACGHVDLHKLCKAVSEKPAVCSWRVCFSSLKGHSHSLARSNNKLEHKDFLKTILIEHDRTTIRIAGFPAAGYRNARPIVHVCEKENAMQKLQRAGLKDKRLCFRPADRCGHCTFRLRFLIQGLTVSEDAVVLL